MWMKVWVAVITPFSNLITVNELSYILIHTKPRPSETG